MVISLVFRVGLALKLTSFSLTGVGPRGLTSGAPGGGYFAAWGYAEAADDKAWWPSFEFVDLSTVCFTVQKANVCQGV